MGINGRYNKHPKKERINRQDYRPPTRKSELGIPLKKRKCSNREKVENFGSSEDMGMNFGSPDDPSENIKSSDEILGAAQQLCRDAKAKVGGKRKTYDIGWNYIPKGVMTAGSNPKCKSMECTRPDRTIYRLTESRFVVKLKKKTRCASTTQYYTMQFHCNQHCMMSALLNNRSIPLVVGDLKQTDGHVNDMLSRMARELEALTCTEGLLVFPQHFKDEICLRSKTSASSPPALEFVYKNWVTSSGKETVVMVVSTVQKLL